MKLFLLTFIFCLCSLTSLKAQETTNLDSLEATLENLSWKELDSIGKGYRNKYDFAPAEVYLKKALQVAEKQNGKDSLYALSCKELGTVYYYQGMYDETDFFWVEAKDIREKIFGKNHSDYAISCDNLAILYQSKGLIKKLNL